MTDWSYLATANDPSLQHQIGGRHIQADVSHILRTQNSQFNQYCSTRINKILLQIYLHLGAISQYTSDRGGLYSIIRGIYKQTCTEHMNDYVIDGIVGGFLDLW